MKSWDKRTAGVQKDAFRGEKIKIPSPDCNQGWDTNVFHGSTLVAPMEPLIDALTGVPGVAFPHTQLGSGITLAVLQSLFTNRPLSVQLFAVRVFVTAFMEKTYHKNAKKSIPVEQNSEFSRKMVAIILREKTITRVAELCNIM